LDGGEKEYIKNFSGEASWEMATTQEGRGREHGTDSGSSPTAGFVIQIIAWNLIFYIWSYLVTFTVWE
jgi:hypothetical protein